VSLYVRNLGKQVKIINRVDTADKVRGNPVYIDNMKANIFVEHLWRSVKQV